MPPSTGRHAKKLEKFGVTDNYRNLNLHSAAASGNVGLVKFALSNGQPVSSVLNGVLPIHAACANGNEAIVRMLIENGADVNAPRLPRRYSNDRRNTGAISVGTSGSTPLHFAAANGHVNIVELLLSCGARPDLTEKHGLTPEAVARQHGHADVVAALQKWDRHAALEYNKASRHDVRHGIKSATLPPPGLHNRSPTLTSSTSLSSLRQLANRTSTVSLTSLSKAKRADELQRQASTPVTYSALTLQPNPSTQSIRSLESIRRPSLPSVFEKATSKRDAIRQALGLTQSSKSSVLSASNGSSRPPPLTLKASNTDAFDQTAMARRASTSSTRSTIASVLGLSRKQSSTGSATVSPMETPDEHAHSSTFGSDGAPPSSSGSGERAASPPTASPNMDQAKTAPPTQTTFPALPSPAVTSPLSTGTSSSTSPFPETQRSLSSIRETGTNRPRKSSLLSSREAITASSLEVLEREGADRLPDLANPTSRGHLRSPSAGSDFSSLSVRDDGEQQHYRGQSHSRIRTNSNASATSNVPRQVSSPLESISGDSLPSSSSGVVTRQRRSASTSTDPDLRHLVLSNTNVNSDTLTPGSPVSTSSWSRDSPLSLHSTPATSVVHSVKDGSITPAMVQDMVNEAEARLMSYDPSSAKDHSQPSLSEQLAAYSDTLALQRQLNGVKDKSSRYTFERLERGGGRTPIEIGDAHERVGTLPGSRPFQQGVLDARKLPTPQLRQSATGSDGVLPLHQVAPSWPLQPGSAFNAHRASTPSGLHYKILGSNHGHVSSSQSTRSVSASVGRRSPSLSIDDPVLGSASSQNSDSSSPSHLETKTLRASTIKRQQQHRHTSSTVEAERPPVLLTPIASRGEPHPPFGIEGAEIASKDRHKSRFGRTFQSIKKAF